MEELKASFKDCLNYEAEDPLEPIDPLTYRTPEGDSCLHIAAIRGDRRAVELLLQAGVAVDQRGDMGCTALHYARSFGHDDIAQMLLDHGADGTIIDEFGRKAAGP